MGIEPTLLPSEGSVLPLNEHPMYILTTVVFTHTIHPHLNKIESLATRKSLQPISLHEVRQLSVLNLFRFVFIMSMN